MEGSIDFLSIYEMLRYLRCESDARCIDEGEVVNDDLYFEKYRMFKTSSK